MNTFDAMRDFFALLSDEESFIEFGANDYPGFIEYVIDAFTDDAYQDDDFSKDDVNALIDDMADEMESLAIRIRAYRRD